MQNIDQKIVSLIFPRYAWQHAAGRKEGGKTVHVVEPNDGQPN